jgi:hypothetical protein
MEYHPLSLGSSYPAKAFIRVRQGQDSLRYQSPALILYDSGNATSRRCSARYRERENEHGCGDNDGPSSSHSEGALGRSNLWTLAIAALHGPAEAMAG